MFSGPSVCQRWPDLKSGRQRHFFPFLSFPSLPIFKHVFHRPFLSFSSFLSVFFFLFLIPIFYFLVFALCLKRGQDVLAELFSMSEVGMQLDRRPTVHVCNLWVFYRKENSETARTHPKGLLTSNQIILISFSAWSWLPSELSTGRWNADSKIQHECLKWEKNKIFLDLLRLWEIEM